MKILFITDLYPVKSDEKATPKTLLNFVKEWQKENIVDVIKPNFILNSFVRKKPFYKSDKYNNILNINYWTPFWFDITKKLSKFNIDTDNYDLVIAHMPSGILFADKLGKPFVAGIHNSDLEVLTNPLYCIHFKKRMIKALNNAQKIACRSYVIKDKLLKLYPEFEEKTFVAPSGIDENIICENIKNYEILRCAQNDRNEKIKVLTCANFKKRKNIDKVINALKGLDGFELTVIGDGNIRKSLEKLDKNVKFTGRLSNDKVLEYMRESDIFILPSVNETFGMVYLEAMASGCTTICTENDGISGIIIHGENGYLTKPDTESIRNLFIELKNTDEMVLNTIRQNSFETVKNLTSSKCADNYLQSCKLPFS